MKNSGDYSTDATILQYLKFSLEARVKAGIALDEQDKKEFANQLSRLHREYFTKFTRRSDVERPGFAETEFMDLKQPRPVEQLNFEQQKALYFQILKLQEKLGHTSIETAEWEDEEI